MRRVGHKSFSTEKVRDPASYRPRRYTAAFDSTTQASPGLHFVSMSGVEPLSEAYESPVLTVELHRHVEILYLKKIILPVQDYFLKVYFLVAGTRIALMPTGYEPVEVLLLQPAIVATIIQKMPQTANLDNLKFFKYRSIEINNTTGFPFR